MTKDGRTRTSSGAGAPPSPEGKAPETKRLTASERESLLRLNVAMEVLILDVAGPLKERAKLVPYGRRDMAMLAAVARRLLEGFVDTIPMEQMPTYRRALEMVSYTIGVKKPGPSSRDEKQYGMWIPYEVLNALLAGCHDHCLMCSLDKAQRRSCELRKALTIIPNDSEERRDGDCPYYGLI